MIFEYGVKKRSCAAKHVYAQQWLDLQSLSIGSPQYNTALQAITDQFATAGADPSKPNKSSLNQLRTNEISLGVSPWELREFQINAASHQLVNVTTKREPQIPFNSQGQNPIASQVNAFGDFVNANMRKVINDKMEIPATLNGVPFLGAKAHTLNPTTFHWDAAVTAGTGHIINDTARFHISLNACSGCHGGETKTGNFTHVGLPSGGAARLSPFLTGAPAFSSTPFLVPDPANRPSAANPILWPFNDLERRGRDLRLFVLGRCGRFSFPRLVNQRVPIWLPIELTKELTFNPVTMDH